MDGEPASDPVALRQAEGDRTDTAQTNSGNGAETFTITCQGLARPLAALARQQAHKEAERATTAAATILRFETTIPVVQ